MAEPGGPISLPSAGVAAPEGIAVFELDGSLKGADPQFTELTGLKAEDSALGHFEALLDWLRPRVHKGELSTENLSSGTHAEVEIDGKGRLELRLRSLSIGGVDAGTILSLRDRAEHQRLQQRAHQEQKMAAIGRLVGGISHDFNNLLTVIRGYSDFSREQLDALDADLLLGQRAQCATLRGCLEEIAKASIRASQLTRQLLAYSRQQVVSPQLLDLNAELREVEKMLQRLLGENIILQRDERLRPAIIRADRGQIHQMIMNLVINARDAMPNGGRITLRTEAFNVDKAFAGRFDYPVELGEKVLLRVIDTGTGIDPAAVPHIFEPFFTTKEIGHGTGLGLSTVYGIIKQSGGYIWVDSAVGGGTEFRICLPLEEGPVHSRPLRAKGPSPSVGQRILIVDDDDQVRQIIGQLLANAGYQIEAAATPKEALEIQAAGTRFDLVVTDLVMAEMDGSELARRLSSAQEDLKVLFISGYDPDAYDRRGVMPEGAAFLEKPLDAETLRSKISQILET